MLASILNLDIMFDFCSCPHFLLPKILDLKIKGSIQIAQKFVKGKCRQGAAKINRYIYSTKCLSI